MFTKGSNLVSLLEVSVTLDTVIRHDMAPRSKRGKDVTFEPYEERMPKGLSRRDRYQFLMYPLVKDERYSPQSGEHIISICFTITNLKKVKVVDVRMGATRLFSALVDRCNNKKRIKQNKATCVQDYI